MTLVSQSTARAGIVTRSAARKYNLPPEQLALAQLIAESMARKIFAERDALAASLNGGQNQSASLRKK